MSHKGLLIHKHFTLFTLFIVAFLTISCSDSKPDKLIIDYSNDLNSSILATDRASQLNVYALYDDGSKENITNALKWSTSDTNIATVTQGLILTNSNTGSVDIIYETYEKTSIGSPFYINILSITVQKLHLTDISLSVSELSLSVGTKKSITANGTFKDSTDTTVVSQDITMDCNWSSGDESISRVVFGTIEGISEGNTTITASDSNLSASAIVEVQSVNYVSISIYTLITDFNVEQTIVLEARAVTDENQTLILKANDLKWSSSDETVIEMNENIATAVVKGSAIITATLKQDRSLSASQTLNVKLDRYIRLFKEGMEVEFPYSRSESNTTLSPTLGTFTLRPVGEEITIRTLHVQDFNNNILTSAFIDGLEVGDTINADKNRTFTLKHNGLENNLNLIFYFDINASSSFKQTYEVTH